MALKRKIFLTLTGVILLALVALLALQQPRAARAQDESKCLACHSDQARLENLTKRAAQVYVDPALYREESHGGLECTRCHAGNPTKDTPEEACVGFAYKDPAEPEVISDTCGSCHPEIAARHVNSIHRTLSGIQLSLHDFINPEEGEQRFQATCNKCHASCSDCHMEQPGAHGVLSPRTESHHFEANPPTENCVACHEGTGMSFIGDEKKEGRVPSVMSAAGLHCMSCHTEQDVHGTGVRTNFLVESPKPECETCHNDPTHAVALDGDMRVAPQLDPDNPAHVQHEGTLSCQACHTAWYENCWACHNGREDRSNINVYLAVNPLTGLIHPAVHSPASGPDWGTIPLDVGGGWAVKSRHSWTESKSCEYCHTDPDVYISDTERRSPFIGVWGPTRRSASFVDEDLRSMVVLDVERAKNDIHKDVTCEECHASMDDSSCSTCHAGKEKTGKTVLPDSADWSRQDYMTAFEGLRQIDSLVERAGQLGLATGTWEAKKDELHTAFLQTSNDFHGNPGTAQQSIKSLASQIVQLGEEINTSVVAAETRRNRLRAGVPLAAGLAGATVLGILVYRPEKKKKQQGEDENAQ